MTEAAPSLGDLRIKVFADGAAIDDIRNVRANPLIKGFTTNPTLMRKAGVDDYREFARLVLTATGDLPVSFEVFADEFGEMEEQAREIATWGEHVYVKIPVTNCAGEFAGPLISRLASAGVKVNTTAVMTVEQVRRVADALDGSVPSVVSVFAGRIADTGRDPVPIMEASLDVLDPLPTAELLWASPREVLNLFQADAVGCDIVTVTHDLLAKLGSVGKSLDDFSLETVQMFRRDAEAANYTMSPRVGAAKTVTER